MTLLSLVEVLQLGVYLVLAAFAVEQWRRHRSEAATWLAGTVLVLTLLVTSGRFVQPDDPVPRPAVGRPARHPLLGATAVILNVALLILVGTGGQRTGASMLWQQSAGLVSGVLFLVGFAPPRRCAPSGDVERLRRSARGRPGSCPPTAGRRWRPSCCRTPSTSSAARGAVLVGDHGEVRGGQGVTEDEAAAIALRLRASVGTGETPSRWWAWARRRKRMCRRGSGRSPNPPPPDLRRPRRVAPRCPGRRGWWREGRAASPIVRPELPHSGGWTVG